MRNLLSQFAVLNALILLACALTFAQQGGGGGGGSGGGGGGGTVTSISTSSPLTGCSSPCTTTATLGLTSPLPAANGGTGVGNTATLTLGTSNQNWATLGTGIVKNTTTTGALSDAASSDVIGLWTGSCSSSTYLNGAGVCTTPSGTAPALSAVTGSAAQATGTEVAAGDNYTFAGIETGNLTSYITVLNGNSTNNNTNIGLLVGATGTSTGGIGEVVFDVAGTGDLVRWYSGGSVSNGTYTTGTLEAHLSATGAISLGSSAPTNTLGSAGALIFANGSAYTGAASTSGIYGNSTNSCVDLINLTTDYGCIAAASNTVTFTNKSISLQQITSATGAVATLANGNNPLVISCALTSGTTCLTTSEATAATTAGAVEHQITTLTTTTAIPLQITQGAAGPAAANAPAVINVSAASAGGAASASINGLTGAPITFLTGAGSAGGATTGNGGTGGAFTVTLGAGGAHGGTTTNTGGVGGAFALTPGAGTQGAATGAGGAAGTLTVSGAAGGAGGSTSGTGGAGSDFLVTTGTGGAATSGSTTGRGGNAVFTLGSAGGTGTAGAPGQFEITAGTVGAANTTPFLNLTGTWNTTGAVNAGIFENITNTASGSGSSLMTLEASSTSEFAVNSQAANSFALGPNIVLGGTAPEITLGGTTPYLSIPATHGTFNPCRISTAVTLTTTTTICTWTLPAAAVTWSYQCTGSYQTNTSSITLTLGTQFADAATNSNHFATIWSAASTMTSPTTAISNTGTSATVTLLGVAPAASTAFPWNASGTFTGSATSGTFVIYGTASTSSDAQINAGSSCYLF